jgi:hypothetical protein
LIFRIFSEASSGKKIPDHIVQKFVQQFRSMSKQKTSRKKHYKKKKSPGPAFATQKNGGIFGLKK